MDVLHAELQMADLSGCVLEGSSSLLFCLLVKDALGGFGIKARLEFLEVCEGKTAFQALRWLFL